MNSTSKNKSHEFTQTKDLIINHESEFLSEDENFEIDLNMNTLHNEFDDYISELHRKLQIVKEERKRSEKETKILKHRVTLLHNQEKLAVQKFEKTRNKLEKIIDNRKFINNENNLTKLARQIKETNLAKLKENAKNRRANLKSCHNLHQIKNCDRVRNDEKDKYWDKDLDKVKKRTGSDKSFINKQKLEKENCELIKKSNDYLDKIEDQERKKQINEKKDKLKKELMKKIQDDELERNKLENELASVENEEIRIMRIFQDQQQEKLYQNNPNNNLNICYDKLNKLEKSNSVSKNKTLNEFKVTDPYNHSD